MNQPRVSIVRQAVVRLVASLGLLMLLVGVSMALIYQATWEKAAQERAQSLADFYRARLDQQERQWELQTADLRIRIEYARILEHPPVDLRDELQAFLTVQRGARQFAYLLVQDRQGREVFSFGKELSLGSIPVPADDDRGWHADREGGRIYRVFTDRIWLGERGMGRLALFYPVDNALLYNLTAPGVTLTTLFRDKPSASSAGSAGLAAAPGAAEDGHKARLSWSGRPDCPMTLLVDAPVKPLFSMLQLAVGVGLVPLVDGLILWLALGTWLMRGARRIGHLGEAVESFARLPAVTRDLRERLGRAAGSAQDEIHAVAQAIESLAEKTERREEERKVEEANRRLWAMVFANSNEAILITDKANRILAVNTAFTQLTGYGEAEVVGENPRILSAHREPPEFYADMWQHIAREGFWRGEIYDRRKDGSVYPKWLSIAAVRDGQGTVSHYVGMFSDITERKVAEERIVYLATHDTLTGLPNRQLLQDRLENAIALSRREETLLAILFLDLDRFKWVNDSLGHDCGDALLKAVAERLKAVVREADTVARLGGDEFVVLLRNPASVADVAQVAMKLVEVVAKPVTVKEQVLNVTTSVGASLFPHDGATPAALLQHADTAMYAAKAVGRNQVCFFDPSMNRSAVERLEIEHGLRHALAHGEFELFYQPKICVQAGGRACGAEVLLRWRRPEHGLVPPDKFIPVAEETGFIVELGEWVIRAACEQARRWHEAGAPIALAVNLSAAQLESDSLVPTVARIVEEVGLPRTLLEFELTESTVLRNPDRSLRTLEQLRELGFGLALDDFGTGYSSLSYLKRLPITTVKIDRSFVEGVPADKDDVQIVSMIVALARAVGLEVVAEGIETEAQKDYLEAIGCHMLQGYYFAKPMPLADFEAWLGDARCNRCATAPGS